MMCGNREVPLGIEPNYTTLAYWHLDNRDYSRRVCLLPKWNCLTRFNWIVESQLSCGEIRKKNRLGFIFESHTLPLRSKKDTITIICRKKAKKVKHEESETSAVAGIVVVMSTLSLSCSILNYKDSLPFSTEEIKHLKWHARAYGCQCLNSNVRLCGNTSVFSYELIRHIAALHIYFKCTCMHALSW